MDTMRETYAKVSELTGNNILALSTYEGVIDTYIIQHYGLKGRNALEFRNDVLDNEYFSQNLKVRILGKILKKQKIDFPFKELGELQKARNKMAHGSLNARRINIETVTLYHGGKEYNFADLHNDFVRNRDIVEEALFALPGIAARKPGDGYIEVLV